MTVGGIDGRDGVKLDLLIGNATDKSGCVDQATANN